MLNRYTGTGRTGAIGIVGAGTPGIAIIGPTGAPGIAIIGPTGIPGIAIIGPTGIPGIAGVGASGIAGVEGLRRMSSAYLVGQFATINLKSLVGAGHRHDSMDGLSTKFPIWRRTYIGVLLLRHFGLIICVVEGRKVGCAFRMEASLCHDFANEATATERSP